MSKGKIDRGSSWVQVLNENGPILATSLKGEVIATVCGSFLSLWEKREGAYGYFPTGYVVTTDVPEGMSGMNYGEWVELAEEAIKDFPAWKKLQNK